MSEFFKGSVTPKDWVAVGGVLAFTVLLAVAFYFAVYSAQATKYQELAAKDTQLLADLKVARETKLNIGQLREEASKMQELVKKFEERLPEKREIPSLLRQFEGFAKEIGLRVELSQLPILSDVRKQTIPYTVKAYGNFHQIVSFINRLEKFRRYLKVSDLNIGEEEEGIAEATFILSTFLFLQPGEGGSTS
jgi:Tfp pilus assembly protein PilO